MINCIKVKYNVNKIVLIIIRRKMKNFRKLDKRNQEESKTPKKT